MDHKFIKHQDTLCAVEPAFNATTKPHKMPIVASSTFQFESIEEGIEIFKQQPGSHVYSRYGNPTIEAVAQKIADLEVFGSHEQAYGVLCSSGMAAIHTVIQSLLKHGDTIITQGNLYGGTTEQFTKIFSKHNIRTTIVELSDLSAIYEALNSAHGNKLIYIETPANPTLQCLDIRAISKIAREKQSILVVDNTFATPCLQQPLLMGADVVVHSTTKYLHGHGISTGGAVICKQENLFKQFWETMKLVGTNSNAFDAWFINLGLKTLSLRMNKQCKNAMSLAMKLSELPQIKKVNYPGLESDPNHFIAKNQMRAYGAMLSFEVGNSAGDAIRFANKLKLCKIAPSLGETDTMILHPATMSHMKLPVETRLKYGITDSLIRFSVGIEHVDDIYDDIMQALRG
jgi:methionine-gamma-lyase